MATHSRSISPWRRVWLRFKRQRLGYWSLIALAAMLVLSLAGELLSNERPLLVVHQGHWYFPLVNDYSERQFGGALDTEADWLDPQVLQLVRGDGGQVLRAPNPYSHDSLNYFSAQPHPAPPSADNVLGTDTIGRDVLARLLYGFRVSFVFGILLAIVGTVIGTLFGLVMGYFGGRVDFFGQRLLEIWSAMPELYLLIIFASMFKPSMLLLVVLLSLFSWIGLSDYVRAEFLRNRQAEYVRAARVMGLSHAQIIWRHIMPNSLTPVITFLPFRISGAIVVLTSLDFLGIGVPPPTPSLGELLAQGKANLYAWWILVPTFGVLTLTLLLLTLVGDALRNAFDLRDRSAGAAL
ncbi:microcin C transport system permease protein [Corticibacter populi]|nr:ABC transporter permease [Corticibacter populi]RZS30834.1 microcin C transport system permease protein [Corticibacter populi]